MPSRLTVVLVSLLLATPAVIFWLWMLFWPASVAILCPEGCRCDPGGYYVKCVGTSLTTPPLIQQTDVRVLSFIYFKIMFLEKNNFVSLTELEILLVGECGLKTIEVGAFNGLTKLKHLTIIDNEISEIIPGTFKDLLNLEFIALWNNTLKHVESAVFSGLINLKYIFLPFNQIHYLNSHTFLRLPNLQHLYFGINPTLQIPTDSNFINSVSLSHLYIPYCNVSSLSVETFANVSALKYLDLRHNKLRTVDINILTALPKLSTLYLEGNPLQCDCRLQEVWRWCEDRNIETDYVECDTPSEVEGMWWGVLEKGECLEGNIQYYGGYNSTSYNNTHTKVKYNVEFFKQYQVPVYAFPFIFGTTGNVIILIIIICNKDMRTLPNMYIVNLAISDTIYLTVLFAEACVNRESVTWPYSGIPCTIIPFCRRLSVCLSAYSVAVLSIQRYRVTVYPLHVRVSSPPTWRGTAAAILGVWIVAALLAVPSTISNDLCEEWTFLESTTYYHRVVIFELLAFNALPLCVIAFTYIMTARHLVESSRSISEGTENPQLETRRTTAKIVVGLTVVFLISYVPYHVFWTYIIWTQDFEIIFMGFISEPKYAMEYLISNCLLLINSCLNPVALFCTSSPIRQHLKHYLTCFCKTNSTYTEFELTIRN
jgi:hypothetical protein